MKILMQFVKESDYYKTLSEGIIKSSGLTDKSFDTVYSFKEQDIKIWGGKDSETKILINGLEISNYSKLFIYNLGKDKVNTYLANLIAVYATNKGVQVINSQELYNFRTGKILEKLLLSLNNIPTPKFYFSNIIPDYKVISEMLGGEFIAKQSRSNFGKKVFLITNEKEFLNLNIKQNSDEEGLWFFEEFISHEYSTRGIVTGDRVTTAIKVSREKDSFKTNHGEAVFYKNEDTDFETLCVKASKLMKLELAGVDTVNYEGQTLILEINKSPGITVKSPSMEIDQIAQFLKL